MRIKCITKLFLAILFGCTLVSSCANSLMIGSVSRTIFPFSHYLIVGCIWLYGMFDSYLSLLLSLIMIGILVIALVRTIFFKKNFLPVIALYLFDLIIVLYLLISSYGYGYEVELVLSGIVDVTVVLLMLPRHNRGQEGGSREP